MSRIFIINFYNSAYYKASLIDNYKVWIKQLRDSIYS